MATVQPMWYNSLGRLFVHQLNEHDAAGVEEMLAQPCNLRDYDSAAQEGFDDFFHQIGKVHYTVRHVTIAPKISRENAVIIDYERTWVNAEDGEVDSHVAADKLLFNEQGLIPRVAYARRPVKTTDGLPAKARLPGLLVSP